MFKDLGDVIAAAFAGAFVFVIVSFTGIAIYAAATHNQKHPAIPHPPTIKQECIDGVTYDVLEYGKFLRFVDNKTVSC